MTKYFFIHGFDVGKRSLWFKMILGKGMGRESGVVKKFTFLHCYLMYGPLEEMFKLKKTLKPRFQLIK